MKVKLMAMLLLAAATVLPSTEASATTCIGGYCFGGEVFHSVDSGYDPSIAIRCNFGQGSMEFVAEGTSSKQDCGVDTDEIYIRAGEELWCVQYTTSYGTVYEKVFDATGYHKIDDLFDRFCTLRAD